MKLTATLLVAALAGTVVATPIPDKRAPGYGTYTTYPPPPGGYSTYGSYTGAGTSVSIPVPSGTAAAVTSYGAYGAYGSYGSYPRALEFLKHLFT
ncbi:hypothetical protein BP6252_03509 [Coleophoma cylindrospora]|uniref:Uncharacterized protein n=1 Tax=Coleophoma cylindrospora TaxID=1849047 RepID=A0A3D8S7U8_9HELO|nr:hypothetical protein BP6252_03509 [Coleophoma cylindrospora]